MRPEELAGNVAALVIMGVVIAVIWGILAYICYLLSDALKALPPEHQKMSPGLVWLLMIPCFSIIWNFFVFIQLPQSYESYLRSHGRPMDTSLGTLGIVYSALAVLCVIPYLGSCIGLAALVILIIFLVKLSELKRVARELGAAPSAPAYGAGPGGFGGPPPGGFGGPPPGGFGGQPPGWGR